MKIREDFVSNSSSSSFVLYGVMFDKDELLEKLKSSPFENVQNAIAECGDDVDSIVEELLNCSKDYVIDFQCIVIGTDPKEMKDNETLLDFKKSIVNKIKALGVDVNEKNVDLYRGIDSDGQIDFD